MHRWKLLQPLGANSARAPLLGGENRLVLLVRGDLFRRHPNAHVYAVEAAASADHKRRLTDRIFNDERAVIADAIEDVPPPRGGPAPRYQLETRAPARWIPLLPVAVDRGARRHRTRTLRGGAREEEFTRAGTQVPRVAARSRWSDGSTYLWIARRKIAGAGEGSSGLRYDLAGYYQSEGS